MNTTHEEGTEMLGVNVRYFLYFTYANKYNALFNEQTSHFSTTLRRRPKPSPPFPLQGMPHFFHCGGGDEVNVKDVEVNVKVEKWKFKLPKI